MTPPLPRGPVIDPDVTGFELDKDVRRELTTLRAEAAESASMHLVMVARLLDEDPEGAYAHAEAARRHGPRVAVIREALGIAAYHAGKYAEALAEFRAARRISGNQEHWPTMADCERALGHPEKALQMAAAPEVAQLTRAARVEMRIVAAGARADLGQFDAAVVTLQSPELQDSKPSEWSARLRFAYAAALEAAGRHEEARTWFERAAEADPDGLTDASERLAELDGVVFLPDEEFDDEDDAGEPVMATATVGRWVAEVAATVGASVGDADASPPDVDQPAAEVHQPVAELEEPVAQVDEPAVEEAAVKEEAVDLDEPAPGTEDPAEMDEPAVVAEEPPARAEPALAVDQAAAMFREPVSAVDQAAAKVREPVVEFSQTALMFDEPPGESAPSSRADG